MPDAAAATHTFNAMRLFHQHEPAIMGAVLESDVYCEAICDGRHLHPGSVRFLLKMKGYDRVIAIIRLHYGSRTAGRQLQTGSQRCHC